MARDFALKSAARYRTHRVRRIYSVEIDPSPMRASPLRKTRSAKQARASYREFITKLATVERVVLNALEMRLCRLILRVRPFLCHRLEDKTIHQKILNFFLSSAAFLLYKTAPEEFICPVIVKSCSASPSWH